MAVVGCVDWRRSPRDAAADNTGRGGVGLLAGAEGATRRGLPQSRRQRSRAKTSEEPPAAKPKQSEEGKGKSDKSPAGMRPGRRPSKESMLSKDSKDDGGSSAGGGGSSDEEEDSSVQDRLPFADERAARDRLLDTASVVLKSFNVANNGLQELELLSVRKLAFKLDTRDRGTARHTARPGYMHAVVGDGVPEICAAASEPIVRCALPAPACARPDDTTITCLLIRGAAVDPTTVPKRHGAGDAEGDYDNVLVERYARRVCCSGECPWRWME